MVVSKSSDDDSSQQQQPQHHHHQQAEEEGDGAGDFAGFGGSDDDDAEEDVRKQHVVAFWPMILTPDSVTAVMKEVATPSTKDTGDELRRQPPQTQEGDESKS